MKTVREKKKTKKKKKKIIYALELCDLEHIMVNSVQLDSLHVYP